MPPEAAPLAGHHHHAGRGHGGLAFRHTRLPYPPLITLTLIGIGTGNPDHLTRQAIRALNAADLILLPRKGAQTSDLADLRRQILAEVAGRITDTRAALRAKHGWIMDIYLMRRGDER